MTIRVLTLHYGGAPYLSITRAINERYCLEHGLELVVVERLYQERRDAIWSKVTQARTNLDGCDLLLYLDGDAVFCERSAPPIVLTNRLPEGKSMLIGEDVRRGAANTGVWLVRNDEAGRAILDAWDATTAADPTLGRRWPLDEAGFNERVLPEHLGAIELVPRRTLDLLDGSFIKHPCGLALTAKTEFLARIAKRF